MEIKIEKEEKEKEIEIELSKGVQNEEELESEEEDDESWLISALELSDSDSDYRPEEEKEKKRKKKGTKKKKRKRKRKSKKKEKEDWQPIKSQTKDFQHEILPPKLIIPQESDPPTTVRECFNFLFTEEIWEFFDRIQHSQIYRDKDEDQRQNAMFRYWAVILIMSLNRVNNMRKFWKRNSVNYNPSIVTIMSRNEFTKMHANWSFTQGGETVDHLLNLINQRFSTIWIPATQVALDESVAPFRGRCKWRVRIPSKPHPTGLQFWMLVDSFKWIYYLEIYKRDPNKKVKMIELVPTLVSNLPEERNFDIYMDSRFGGEDVSRLLISSGHRICCCCMATRPSHLFKDRLHKDLTPGTWKSVETRINNQVVIATSWRERIGQKKKVNIISNCTSDQAVKITKKVARDKTISYSKAKNVLDYSKNMGYVDKANQAILTNWIWHRTRNWKRIVLMWGFKCMVQNSYRIYQLINGNSTRWFPDFQEELAEDLGGISQDGDPRKHKKVKISYKGKKTRHCHWCYLLGRGQSSTVWKCKQCDLPFHSSKGRFCFKDYHNHQWHSSRQLH